VANDKSTQVKRHCGDVGSELELFEVTERLAQRRFSPINIANVQGEHAARPIRLRSDPRGIDKRRPHKPLIFCPGPTIESRT
jgi:hypothetical protein